MKIQIEHFKQIGNLSKPQCIFTSWLEVERIEEVKEHDMVGSSGFAVTSDGERLPVSKLYVWGHTWTTCVNDDTGQRWA